MTLSIVGSGEAKKLLQRGGKCHSNLTQLNYNVGAETAETAPPSFHLEEENITFIRRCFRSNCLLSLSGSSETKHLSGEIRGKLVVGSGSVLHTKL